LEGKKVPLNKHRKRWLAGRIALLTALACLGSLAASGAIACWEICRGAGKDQLYLHLLGQIDTGKAAAAQIDSVTQAASALGIALDDSIIGPIQAALETAVAASLPAMAAQAASFVGGRADSLDLRLDLTLVRQSLSQHAAQKASALGAFAGMAVQAALSSAIPDSIPLGDKLPAIGALLRTARVAVASLERLIAPFFFTALGCLLLSVLVAFDWRLFLGAFAFCCLVAGGLVGIMSTLVPSLFLKIFSPSFYQWTGLLVGAAVLTLSALAAALASRQLRKQRP
jgi:hypothetical protein